MARVLLFAFVIGVTVYALLDWVMNAKKGSPGGLSRWLWLAVIIFLPVIGPLAWIVLRLVGSAEARQSGSNIRPERTGLAPDDDTEFLDDWSRRIARRQKRSGEDPKRSSKDDEDSEDPKDDEDPGESGPTPR